MNPSGQAGDSDRLPPENLRLVAPPDGAEEQRHQGAQALHLQQAAAKQGPVLLRL